jgi:D-psicose/D-tagatose/L-ribulose 3-epimerase
MMKLGVSAFNWSRTFEPRDVDLLPAVRENGFEAFEIPIFDPTTVQTTPLRRAFKAHGLACTVCCILTDGINPISDDPAELRRAKNHLAACIETAAELGAKLIGGPMYGPIGYLPGRRRNQDEWMRAVECFRSLGDLLDANAMTLALEPVNRAETYFLTTAQETSDLCAEINHPRIGVLVDTFHANIEEKHIPRTIASLGPRLMHMHLSENDRGILGSGHVDFPAILHALKSVDYDGYLVIEGLGYLAPECNAPVFMWRRPDETPEEIAFQGAAYLRAML